MSDNLINASNKAQLAAQQQAKNTNDLNAQQAGLLLASTKVLAQSSNEFATIPQGLADAIDNAKADPAIWNSFTLEERSQLLIDREDYLKQAVTFREQAVVINKEVAQLEAELTQMTFNGEKLDTNIQLTEDTLRANAGVPADFTISSASTIDDPVSEADPLIPPPLGQVNAESEIIDPNDDLELQEPPGAESEEFTELAEPVDPDELVLLGGEEEIDPFTELAEPVDPEDSEPVLLGGPDEEFEFTELAEPVDPEDSEPVLLGGPDEEGVDNFEPDAVDEFAGIDEQVAANENALQEPPLLSPEEVDAELAAAAGESESLNDNPNDIDGEREYATRSLAQKQATLQAQRKQANDGDWRVKLRLAPSASYLYKAEEPGILQPLAVTDGVVFPYTPQINTNYQANYSTYDLTHSNYRGYFYQNSYVGEITIQATFTAQDTYEANYLLAVIHFFRSVTKMFYGQDAERGAPPPLVYLQGLGQYQFNLAPCVVSQFTYNLPTDVDYIRSGSTNINGTDLQFRRDRQNLPTNPFSSAWQRLTNAGLSKGGLFSPPAPATLGTDRPTYVPTKIDLSLTLLPMQSREQVSKQFSLKQFANGDLLKGGFW